MVVYILDRDDDASGFGNNPVKSATKYFLKLYDRRFSKGLRKSHYNHELATYQTLRAAQGKQIPRLIAAVEQDITPASIEATAEDKDPRAFFQIKGILLEYIDCIRLLDDYNLVNSETRTFKSFMVQDIGDGRCKTFMIDFSHCRARRADETDLEWAEAKWTASESAVPGMMMTMLNNTFGFNLSYTWDMWRAGERPNWEEELSKDPN
ncbi:hypothetical protein B0H63DRAFT_522690 [Podospora didyma]|uniref:Uncharacterized protein n=1 Tax=Podospora didyma TaxID=330526 RepID=A0AAE0NPK2_9PEZI|nr:hypothetical protein B0H63DRAFT_522690 [Podospora didyma]